MPKHLRTAAAALAAFMLLAIAGCSQDDQQKAGSSAQITAQEAASSHDATSSAPADKAAAENITVYFPDANGEKLIAARRQAPPEGEDAYKAAVQSLIDGPRSASEGISVMPKGTKLLGLSVQDRTATVDFSSEFKRNFSGGSTGELMLIGSVVNTLTQFDGIKSVRFTVEGQSLDSLSGHMDLSAPQKRMDSLLK